MGNIKPLSDHIFIELVEEDNTTESGIVIPDTADKERPTKGKVVAVGPGKADENGKRIPMSVKVGDTVLFKKYSPDEIEVDGKTHYVIEESDVLAVIE